MATGIKNHPRRLYVTREQITSIMLGLQDILDGNARPLQLEDPDPLEADIIIEHDLVEAAADDGPYGRIS